MAKGRLKANPAGFEEARVDAADVTIVDLDSSFHVDCRMATTEQETREVEPAVALRVGAGRLRVEAKLDGLLREPGARPEGSTPQRSR